MFARRLLIACALALLAGCKLELPAIDAGTFEHHFMVGGRDQVATGSLSESQVKALVAWLQLHPGGWNYRIEDTGPGLLVYLKQGGVPVLVVNIRAHEVKARDLFRPITPGERAALYAMLGPIPGQ